MTTSRRVRVTLDVPEDALVTTKGFIALLTAALLEFRVKVVDVNKKDLRRARKDDRVN